MLTVVVYVPESHVEAVKDAMFDAGAGRYRAYDRCCWQVAGTGQFRPLAGSSPHVGEQGRVERVQEYRVETICPDDKCNAVVAALRKAHPYEEPAFTVLRNAALP